MNFFGRFQWYTTFLAAAIATVWVSQLGAEVRDADLARQVRAIFSNRCFACHGPDQAQRKAGLRLDNRDSVIAEAESGARPVVAGKPEHSELLKRLKAPDEDERMPPADFGARLSREEIATVERWIQRDAPFQKHWSFLPPVRASLPTPQVNGGVQAVWLKHPIDRFILEAQQKHGFEPSGRAEPFALLRRVSLDLIGLPPSVDEVQKFLQDPSADAYERVVDRLLASPAYGEHWARKWLDLARYADSAGYADDPARTIWGYRDWVVSALNDNLSIEQFTIEQIAGDLLPGPTSDQLVATAFHRNTLTNNEGGTNDEEFRNVAVVDRVNTTMAIWMGVTFNCAQCHSHKYDPFSHEEYYQVFDIFNQSRDADRTDESPVVEIFSREQEKQKEQWLERIDQLEAQLQTVSPEVSSDLTRWEAKLNEPRWTPLVPVKFAAKTNTEATWSEDGRIRVMPLGNNIVKDSYTLEMLLPPEIEGKSIRAVGLRTLPSADLPGGGAGFGGGNFVITSLRATLLPDSSRSSGARFVRIELPGKGKILSLAEVEVLSEGKNVADGGTASQSSTAFNGPAKLAGDGNTNGDYEKGSVTHTQAMENPWWELDLGKVKAIDRLVVWNRTDNNLHKRLDGAEVLLLNANREKVFAYHVDTATKKELSIVIQPSTPIEFVDAFADYHQTGFSPANLAIKGNVDGWAVGGQIDREHLLTLNPDRVVEVGQGARLRIEIDHNSTHRHHLLGSFQLLVSADERAIDWAMLGDDLRQIVKMQPSTRSDSEQLRLAKFFAKSLAPSLAGARSELKDLRTRLATLKPATSVPIMRQIESAAVRKTFVQLRGNYKSLGQQVQAGTPSVFPSISKFAANPDRLALARWLVDRENPLTARVMVNRLWESLFGLGLVRTSEEFGSQGDLPSHPELLDWLACEFMDQGWDVKQMLRSIVTSQTYCQTSQVDEAKLRLDSDNVWLSRGPRVRLSAEMVRDQALAVSGLLTHKFFGPPVRPPQPEMGLKAAFGSDTDWKASSGEDRYRRGLYTTWRRSNPYPSMATFDAPSREVCTLRRDSTNTPLQALVTLNDPGFVEAAQALARRIVLHSPEAKSDEARLIHALSICAARSPDTSELASLVALLSDSRSQLSKSPEASIKLATEPLGPLPMGADPVEFAAWTVVANVLLNLDEVLMKR